MFVQLVNRLGHLSKVKGIVSTIKPLQMIHMDLFGPSKTASIGRKKYVLL